MSDFAAVGGVQQAGRRRPPPIEVDVVRVEPRSGDFVRVVLGGEALRDFVWPGPASHLKFFPPVGGEQSPMGTVPEGAPRPPSRTYTPSGFDAATGELCIDFLLHGDGLCSTWAANATPGDRVHVSLPRAMYGPSPDATWYLLAGDDSSVPAIGTILASSTTGPVEVVIETGSAIDSRPELPVDPSISITWVSTEPEHPGAALERVLRSWSIPAGSGAIWVATEATAVRRIRSSLLQRAVPSEWLTTRGYWRKGSVNHPDHDFGTDELA